MSSKSNPRRTRPSSNAVASSSTTSKPSKTSTTTTASKKRTRAEPPTVVSSVLNDDEDELSGLVGGQDKQVDVEQDEEGEDEDDDEFEIDTGSSNGDLDDFVVASDLEDDDQGKVSKPAPTRTSRPSSSSSTMKKTTTTRSPRHQPEDTADFADSESDEQDSQADLDLDDEEGYNSSDIDALDAESNADSHDSSNTPATSLTSSVDLETLIARHTSKPNEEEYQGAHSVITGGRALLGDGRFNTGKFSSAKEGLGRVRKSKWVEGSFVREYEEFEAGYGSESSTEENTNTIGNVPIEWYDDLPHIGYTVEGRKIMRPAKGDELDRFLATVEDPDSWTTAEDKLLQKQVQLSDKELDIIRRLERAENPDAGFDNYQPTIEWFTGKGNEMVMPLTNRPEPKSRFVPSKWEHKKVMKIVKAIREGRIIPNRPPVEKPKVYAIWSKEDQERTPHAMYMPAPQLPPPKTVESYNPPEEYLFDEGEKAEWDAQEKEDRKLDFEPKKYASLRTVPGYEGFVQERFERCLDLYLAPRTKKVKMNIDPESLVPKLPSPKELRPFPTTSAVQYRHPASSRVRCVSVDPRGEWVASGSEDGVVRVWDLGNGREVWKWPLKMGAVQSVEWCPNRDESVLAATVSGRVYLLSPLALVSPAVAQTTLTHLNTAFASSSASTTQNEPKKIPDAKWVRPTEDERDRGILIIVEVAGTPKQITWHRKGDYFSTVAVDAANKSVLVHQVSKHQTQSPFKRTKGSVQRVAFHPTKPHFFVATQRYVRLYDLVGQQLLKTLMSGLRWISSMDIHPLGDNVIIGSYDKKLCWFDLDLSSKPYKTLRYHTKALRSVIYHRTYPLFASASDDGTIQIFHGTVYSDLMQNPLIVPLKVLRGHNIKDGLGVLDIKWHPTKPWLISSGADGEVRMWT